MGVLAFVMLHALLVPIIQETQERMGAEALIEEAWRHLPEYDGVRRPFLSEGDRRGATAAAHLLEGALALHPGHLRALWSLGHAEALLAEDGRNRGASPAATTHYERAIAALSQAIEHNPHDPWAFYERGVARTGFGNHIEASEDFSAAVAAADVILARSGDHRSLGWLRFKAREWQPEVLMRRGEFDAARAALRAFHGEFPDNEWQLLMALGVSHLRQGDLSGAREVYSQACMEFPSDFGAYASLGLLDGLQSDREAAMSHLTEALAHEPQPGMSIRRWLWILSTHDRRDSLRDEIAEALEQLSDEDWDLVVTRFVLGEGEVEAFVDAARSEEERRKGAGEAIDERMCEAWFYAGVRCEWDAAEAKDPETRKALLARAREAHLTALRYKPSEWSWEREYAAKHLAALRAQE